MEPLTALSEARKKLIDPKNRHQVSVVTFGTNVIIRLRDAIRPDHDRVTLYQPRRSWRPINILKLLERISPSSKRVFGVYIHT